METVVESATPHEQHVARESLPFFTNIAGLAEADQISIELPTGRVSVPTKALQLLGVILSGMAEGKAISLMPTDVELTTQRAAAMLNVSRPHLVSLLETGQIPFRKVGSHRRVLLTDVLQYNVRQQAIRREKLQFLADQGQDLKLGYE